MYLLWHLNLIFLTNWVGPLFPSWLVAVNPLKRSLVLAGGAPRAKSQFSEAAGRAVLGLDGTWRDGIWDIRATMMPSRGENVH